MRAKPGRQRLCRVKDPLPRMPPSREPQREACETSLKERMPFKKEHSENKTLRNEECDIKNGKCNRWEDKIKKSSPQNPMACGRQKTRLDGQLGCPTSES